MTDFVSFFYEIGHVRRPSRPAVEQESLGVRYQGRSVSFTRTHLEEEKRRGRCKREALQLCTGCECEEPEGAADGDCGRVGDSGAGLAGHLFMSFEIEERHPWLRLCKHL